MQRGLDLGATWLQEGWQREPFAKMRFILVFEETGAIGGQLEEYAVWLTEVDRLEIVAFHQAGGSHSRRLQPIKPGEVLLRRWNTEGDVMHTAASQPLMRQIGTRIYVYLCPRPTNARPKDQNLALRAFGGRIAPAQREAHHLGQRPRGSLSLTHGERHGAKTSDTVRRGRCALLPRRPTWQWRITVIHQREPLALRVTKSQRGTPVLRGQRIVLNAQRVKALQPPVQRIASGHAQGNTRDAAHAGVRRRGVGNIEKRYLRPRISALIPIKEVIRRCIVLVDGLFHQTQPQRLRIEVHVFGGLRRQGRDMMQPGQSQLLHLESPLPI